MHGIIWKYKVDSIQGGEDWENAKTKTLKDQQQKQQENGKAELEEIREDNIEAAKRQKSKIIKK